VNVNYRTNLYPALRVLLLALILAGCAASTPVRPAGSYDIYIGKGLFGDIVVSENAKGLRTLEFERGAGRHSVVKPGDPGHLELEYARIALVSLALSAQPPARMLVVGLGGGTLPTLLRAAYPDARIDVSEIDPAVVSVAERYFGFVQDDRLRVHVGDGRLFIERAEPSSYDLIFLDAFDAKAVPRHLTTREFLGAVRAALRPDGVVVANIWGPRANTVYYPMLATFRSVFDELYLVIAQNDVNVMTFALPRSMRLSREQLVVRARALMRRPILRYDLGEMVEKGWIDAVAESAGGTVLRDVPRN
jgi:spermidine synthase